MAVANTESPGGAHLNTRVDLEDLRMLELGRTLARRLRELRVRIDVPDSDTVVYRNVPANGKYFNKVRTDLLLKRPAADMPFLVCVDEDLEYTGPDVRLSRVFRAGVRRDGWLALLPGGRLQTDLHQATLDALSALGFDGQEPVVTVADPPAGSGSPDGLLATFGTNLSQLAQDGKTEPTLHREEETVEVACCLMRWGQARMPVVAGASGIGKTNLLHAVARTLHGQHPDLRFVRIDLARLFAGSLFDAQREDTLSALLNEVSASPDTACAIEHLELAVGIPCGPALLAEAIDAGTRIVGTTLPPYVRQFAVAPLWRRLHVMGLAELSPHETVEVLRAVAEPVATHHRVGIDESCIAACVQAARPLPGHFPAKAIAILDAAAARVALSESAVIGPDDVYFAAGRVDQHKGNSPDRLTD